MGCSFHDQGVIWIYWIPSHMLWVGYSSSFALIAVCLLATSVVQIHGAIQNSLPNNLACRVLAMSKWPWNRVKYFGVRKECCGSRHQVSPPGHTHLWHHSCPQLTHILWVCSCAYPMKSLLFQLQTGSRHTLCFLGQPEHFDGAVTCPWFHRLPTTSCCHQDFKDASGQGLLLFSLFCKKFPLTAFHLENFLLP